MDNFKKLGLCKVTNLDQWLEQDFNIQAGLCQIIESLKKSFGHIAKGHLTNNEFRIKFLTKPVGII